MQHGIPTTGSGSREAAEISGPEYEALAKSSSADIALWGKKGWAG